MTVSGRPDSCSNSDALERPFALPVAHQSHLNYRHRKSSGCPLDRACHPCFSTIDLEFAGPEHVRMALSDVAYDAIYAARRKQVAAGTSNA